MHQLVVQGRTKQKRQVRFEKHHQLFGPSNEQQAVGKAESDAATQQSS
jgi:hypothetical protein